MVIVLYWILLVLFSIYSYWLIDPNITLFQNRFWVQFRDWAVYLGYYRRDISWIVYLTLLILLFICHFICLKKFKHYSAIRIAGFIVFIGCISYPFLSHDLFNYLFDARIFTHYGLNPYTHTALDFQKDLWTRFMHWTHRTYPYGPTFLPLTLIPSYLGLGKFSITLFLYKFMNGVLYFLAVYFLNKKHKKEAMFFATHPLIIIEGLINGHNDMIALSIGLLGVYLLERKYSLWSRFMLLLSAGIKYITLPIVFLHPKLEITRYMKLLFCSQVALVIYLCYKMEIQPWYFLSLFIFLPFFPTFLEELSILFLGLLLSYYPFIRFGDWTAKTVLLKREIFFVALFLQILFSLALYLRKRKFLIK